MQYIGDINLCPLQPRKNVNENTNNGTGEIQMAAECVHRLM